LGTVRLVLLTVHHLLDKGIIAVVVICIAVVVIWIYLKGATTTVFFIIEFFITEKVAAPHEVGAIFHPTLYKCADTPVSDTNSASSVPRASSDLFTAGTLVQKDWLASRTGQKLSSRA
jgi:hypothetical protein